PRRRRRARGVDQARRDRSLERQHLSVDGAAPARCLARLRSGIVRRGAASQTTSTPAHHAGARPDQRALAAVACRGGATAVAPLPEPAKDMSIGIRDPVRSVDSEFLDWFFDSAIVTL